MIAPFTQRNLCAIARVVISSMHLRAYQCMPPASNVQLWFSITNAAVVPGEIPVIFPCVSAGSRPRTSQRRLRASAHGAGTPFRLLPKLLNATDSISLQACLQWLRLLSQLRGLLLRPGLFKSSDEFPQRLAQWREKRVLAIL